MLKKRKNKTKLTIIKLYSFFEPIIMGRRRQVEGITLDLPDVMDYDVSALIEAALKEPPVPKENKSICTPIQKLSEEELRHIVSKIEHRCYDCSGIIMYSPLKWEQLKLCYGCHKQRLIPLSIELNNYMTEKGMTSCSFCNKIRINPSDFHLDHINMFTKSGNIGNMLYNGCNIDNIKREIDKCQLLCVSCHAAVTHFEHKYGFIKAKKSKRSCDIERMEKIYDEYMGEVYSFLRGRGGK